jgi:hypothetical protein
MAVTAEANQTTVLPPTAHLEAAVAMILERRKPLLYPSSEWIKDLAIDLGGCLSRLAAEDAEKASHS